MNRNEEDKINLCLCHFRKEYTFECWVVARAHCTYKWYSQELILEMGMIKWTGKCAHRQNASICIDMSESCMRSSFVDHVLNWFDFNLFAFFSLLSIIFYEKCKRVFTRLKKKKLASSGVSFTCKRQNDSGFKHLWPPIECKEKTKADRWY